MTVQSSIEIIHIEDEIDWRNEVQEFLNTHLDLRVTSFTSSTTMGAIRRASAIGKPCIIIADLRLEDKVSDFDGYFWLVEEMKTFIENNPLTEVFVLSGQLNELILESLIRQGIPKQHIFDKGTWAESQDRFLEAINAASYRITREDQMISIFLSHSWKDKFFVRELAKKIESYGIKVWLDEAELKVGDSLIQKIGEAIETTDFVGVVLSSNSVNSEWVQRELQAAMQKEFRKRKVVVLPILLESVEIPIFLRDKVYADFSTPEKSESSFPQLLKALGTRAEKIEPIHEPKEEGGVLLSKQSYTEQKLEIFEDINIIDLDEQHSYKPDEDKKLYNMYLKLSRTPPSEWEQIFDAERRFPRHTMWRRAWLEGQFIVIHCVPEELEKYHLSDLNEDVKNSNKKYREYLTELAQQEIREMDVEKTERENMKSLKKRLGFGK